MYSNPGLAHIWEDELQRRQELRDSSEDLLPPSSPKDLLPPSSPDREGVCSSASELHFRALLKAKLRSAREVSV